MTMQEDGVPDLVNPQTIFMSDCIDILPLSSLLISYVISDPVYHFVGCDRSFSKNGTYGVKAATLRGNQLGV